MKPSAKSKLKRRIIVRTVWVRRNERDRGAWKVAFADFTTAMMAFFLLLWLIDNANDAQKMAITGYFVQPGGTLTSAGVNASAKLLDERPRTPPATVQQPLSEEQVRQQYQKQELAMLEQLRNNLAAELDKGGSAFGEIKGQIFIDINVLGLRIQIVDRAQRPMFDLGSATLKPYSSDVLHALGPLLNRVPNRITVSGHTDAVAYADSAYSNWELSVDRANSARRALVEGGYPEQKIAAAQGMGAIALYKPEAPTDPSNRRIAIIVLKRAADRSLIATQTPAAPTNVSETKPKQ